MNNAITCAAARAQLALLLYGELSFDQEENVETHLDSCADCRAALDREKALHAAFDGLAIEPPLSLLRECRMDLEARLELEAPSLRTREPWWDRFISMFVSWRPAAALALLTLGFLGARLTPLLETGVTEAGMARVRDVQPAGNGRVQIVLDETRQRTISGGLDDQRIQAWLMEAVRDPSDPGLRAATVDLLNTQAQTAQVRDALIYTMQHDENAGVRLKALEGLKTFIREPKVLSALSETVLTDANPGIRTQAIDLLIDQSGDNLDRRVIGTLQQLMQRENNPGVRLQAQRVLASFNASPGIY